MNFDQQKKQWQSDDFVPTSNWEQKNIQRYWSHPNLRALRRQLIFETICWSLFLALYYSAFDGHLRSNGWNLALAAGLLALIGHGLLGYRLAGQPIGDAPLRLALQAQLDRLKSFRWLSIFLRTTGLVLFFGFILANATWLWEAPRLWLGGTLLIWTIASVAINYGLWHRLLGRLRKTLEELD